ncbi:MAG: hypothetical protein K6D98_06195 [Clostridiales bacterium]|nr:hypothetical protein [Clostridiales bacterium]
MEKSKSLRFASKIIIITVIMLVFCVLGHVLYRSYSKSMSNASYIDKLNRLEAMKDENKAVFVGGSATHFGIHSKYFEEKTGIPSVNMGLNAGTSFGLYINSVKPYMKPGDILFLMPEYGYYEEGWYNDTDNNVEFLLYYAPETIKRTPASALLKYLPTALTVGWKNFGFYFQDSIRKKLSKNKVYLRSSSNEYGDMTVHENLPPDKFADSVYDFENYPFIDKLEENIKYFEDMGVKVYLLFPPLNRTSFEQSEKCADGIYQRLSDDNVKMLYKPEDSAYENDKFFDTVYHLKYESGIEFTDMIIEKLASEEN